MSGYRFGFGMGVIGVILTGLSAAPVSAQSIWVSRRGEPSLIQRLQRRGFRLFTVVPRTKRVVALTGLMITLAFANIGCFTLAGAGLGALADASNKKGSPVTVTLQDSTRISGVSAGTLRQAADAYTERYNAFRWSPEGADLPSPGRAITLVTASGKRKSYTFRGFDRISNPWSKTPTFVLMVTSEGQDRLESAPMPESGLMIDSQGVTLTAADLMARFEKGQLPLMSMVEVKGTTLSVETDQLIALSNADGSPILPTQSPGLPALNTLKKGQPIAAELRDGSRIQGIFLGVEPLATDPYALRYAAQQALPDAALLPALGSPVTLTQAGGKRMVLAFCGFGSHGGPRASGVPYVLVSPVGGSVVEAVRLDTVGVLIEFDGRRLAGYQLRELYRVGKLPLASGVLPLGHLMRLLPQTQVPFDQIPPVATTTREKDHNTSWWAKVGAAVDLFVALGLLLLVSGGVAPTGT